MAAGNKGAVTGMGLLIKRFREEQRMTQRELASATGVSIGALRDLEQGRTRSPRWGALEALAAVLCLGQAQRAELTRAFQIGDPAAARRRKSPTRRLPRVRVEILGPLAAWRDGVRLELGSPRQRAVLGLLALHADVGVHREAIIDMLWPARPPASAAAKVQGYISALRGTLGDGAARTRNDQLVTTVGGCCYCLNTDSGRLDLALFEQLVNDARETAVRPDPASACDRYEQALGLWRADILVDVNPLHGHPARLEAIRRRAEAVLGYAEAACTVDTRVRALPHLRELCMREPLNEQAHAWLMTTLAATGQQAVALQVYAELRQRLDTELAIAPSPVLAQAYTQVLRQQF